MNKQNYFNIPINALNTSELLLVCQKYISQSNNKIIYFINAHCFNVAQKNEAYQSALNEADLILNDGIGIKLGSFFTKIKIKENMNGTDIIPKVLEFSKLNNLNIYLLGGSEGVAYNARLKLEERLPGISIVGSTSGFFDINNCDKIIDDIVKHKTDILIVGMGVPRQELWLNEYRNKLKGVKISIAGGAILDFISGKINRAPNWMRKCGIEWVYRLIHEPFRLFKRYFVGIPVFFFHIVRFTFK